MKFPRRRFLQIAAGAAVIPATSRTAEAQSYPGRPVTLVVGYPAGGPTDSLARIMADGMRTPLGQPVITKNIGGAAGTIAVGKVARAAPDGYTLSFGNFGDRVIAGAVYPLPYNELDDFAPVSLISSHPLLIVAKNSFPAKDLKELIAWLRANPNKGSQGTLGPGSIQHVAGILFQKDSGTQFQFVPYRGSAPAMQDLLSGQIDFLIDPAPNSLPQVRAGAIKAYAVTSDHRLATAPDIPTASEAGLPGFYAGSWHALWAPKGTPTDIIEKLNAAIIDALSQSVLRQRLIDLGQEIFPREQQKPEALDRLQRAEIAKWWPVIKAANIKAE